MDHWVSIEFSNYEASGAARRNVYDIYLCKTDHKLAMMISVKYTYTQGIRANMDNYKLVICSKQDGVSVTYLLTFPFLLH